VATNTDVDEIYASRTIPIRLEESDGKFERDVVPEPGLSLRERLVALRSRVMAQPLEPCPKPMRGRLGDIFRPIIQIVRAFAPDREPDVLEYANKIAHERKAPRNADQSLEQIVATAIIDLEAEILNGVLGIMEITRMVNAGRAAALALTHQRVGRLLDRMGFQKATIGNGRSAIVWDLRVLDQLITRYGIPRRVSQP
jgi:hypothetical protein